MPITHAKVSVIPDGANPNQVQASTDWNADHVGANGTLAEPVTIDLSAADIATLNSSPVEVVAAQGAGTVIVPVAASCQYKAGAHPFGRNALLGLVLPDLDTNGILLIGPMQFAGGVSSIGFGSQAADGYSSQAQAANAALTVRALTEPEEAGPILTVSLGSSGGSGYAPGDTGQIEFHSEDAIYTVDTVDGGGAVLTFHMSFAGTVYGIGSDNTTIVNTGTGSQTFLINIDSIDPLSDGTARLTVLYYVMELL